MPRPLPKLGAATSIPLGTQRWDSKDLTSKGQSGHIAEMMFPAYASSCIYGFCTYIGFHSTQLHLTITFLD